MDSKSLELAQNYLAHAQTNLDNARDHFTHMKTKAAIRQITFGVSKLSVAVLLLLGNGVEVSSIKTVERKQMLREYLHTDNPLLISLFEAWVTAYTLDGVKSVSRDESVDLVFFVQYILDETKRGVENG